uniref:Uncharacterized protein n=1 Tax=Picea sitchensis TaxID=3332 RepID=D5A8I2_PICSI|nr:unknown [Picea sitchensis]
MERWLWRIPWSLGFLCKRMVARFGGSLGVAASVQQSTSPRTLGLHYVHNPTLFPRTSLQVQASMTILSLFCGFFLAWIDSLLLLKEGAQFEVGFYGLRNFPLRASHRNRSIHRWLQNLSPW